MKKYSWQEKNTGFGVIEIMIVVLVFSLGLLTMMQFYRLALSKTRQQQNQTQAVYLASSVLEAVRELRDRDWNNLSSLTVNQDYQLTQGGSPANWQLVSGLETIGQFQRAVKFFAVNRDAEANIVESGGAPDSETKKVRATVSWQERGQNYQINLTTYLTNWQSY